MISYFDYTSALDSITPSDLRLIFVQSCITYAIAALPMLFICALVAVTITLLQTRLLFTFKAAAFKMSRLNPLQGIKRLFSLRSIVELAKSLLKISILGYIIYQTFIKEMMNLPKMIDMSIAQSIAYTGNIILSIAQTAAIIMAFIAAFDYFYQWYDYEKNLRMSKQEVKEEYKQTEGDPQIKGKIRERQQQQARKRMMQNLPNADVIIRNPTHYAVAIQYDSKKNIAPVVIAKGADSLALRIIEVAEKHDIAITENRPLARGLYESVDLDKIIPEQFYQPVAEVLAFVYSLKKKDLNL